MKKNDMELRKVPVVNVQDDWLNICDIFEPQECLTASMEDDRKRGEENAIIEKYAEIEKEKERQLKNLSARRLGKEVFDKLLKTTSDDLIPNSITIDTNNLVITITSK